MVDVYVIGSLRNPVLPAVSTALRSAGFAAFDDWYAAGPHADDCWRDYEKERGHSYAEALLGHAASQVFGFDRYHLKRCAAAVLVLPAGRSAHLELGWILGQNKPGFILLEKGVERWDVMYKFATGVYDDMSDLVVGMQKVLQ
jgi:hypothetical protein